jgi:hypothetical protein
MSERLSSGAKEQWDTYHREAGDAAHCLVMGEPPVGWIKGVSAPILLKSDFIASSYSVDFPCFEIVIRAHFRSVNPRDIELIEEVIRKALGYEKIEPESGNGL